MSVIFDTPYGQIRRWYGGTDARGERKAFWILRCPGCGIEGRLDDDQIHGRVSVDHAAQGCPGGYHETHDFAAAVAALEDD